MPRPESKSTKPIIIEIGLMDDVAPDGSPDTACMLAVEKAGSEGRLIIKKEEISPGIFRVRHYMLYFEDQD